MLDNRGNFCPKPDIPCKFLAIFPLFFVIILNCKVFIPTTPNPTTGFFEIVPVDEVRETTMKVEEAFKVLLSGGVVSSDIFGSLRPIESKEAQASSATHRPGEKINLPDDAVE